MEVNGISFLVRPLTIVQRRKLRALNGFDLRQTAQRISAAIESKDPNSAIVDGAVIDDVLEAAFPDRLDDIDKIGMLGQLELFGSILNASLHGGEEEKNFLRSAAGAPVDQNADQTHVTPVASHPGSSPAAGTN